MEEIKLKSMETKFKNSLYQLIQTHAYRYEKIPFVLSSGLKSNHYFNCKEITLHPERLALLAKAFTQELIPSILKSPPESVGGLTMGADPICYSLALEYIQQGYLVYPIIVRKEAKAHGTKKKMEGFVENVSSCLAVDDVVTTGGSTIKAVEALREQGLLVQHAICIIDREEGGKENLASIGVELYSLFKKSDFI